MRYILLVRELVSLNNLHNYISLESICSVWHRDRNQSFDTLFVAVVTEGDISLGDSRMSAYQIVNTEGNID